MADIELVIKIPEEAYNLLKTSGVDWLGAEHILNAVANGTPLSKGHGDLVDRNDLLADLYVIDDYAGNEIDIIDRMTVEMADAIIEADTESEVKDEKHEVKVEVVTRGNCMMCGKELTEGEGIFFCKECDDKILSIEEVCRK